MIDIHLLGRMTLLLVYCSKSIAEIFSQVFFSCLCWMNKIMYIHYTIQPTPNIFDIQFFLLLYSLWIEIGRWNRVYLPSSARANASGVSRRDECSIEILGGKRAFHPDRLHRWSWLRQAASTLRIPTGPVSSHIYLLVSGCNRSTRVSPVLYRNYDLVQITFCRPTCICWAIRWTYVFETWVYFPVVAKSFFDGKPQQLGRCKIKELGRGILSTI